MRELVFVHGRAQEFKSSTQLKSDWIDAFRKGLAKSGLDLPIPETKIRFPYYGQTLHDLVKGSSIENSAKVIVRGSGPSREEELFFINILEEIRKNYNVSDRQLREVDDSQVVERGILNWEWVQTILKGIDRFVPGASSTSIALFIKDAYEYLVNTGLKSLIDDGVRNAFDPNVETVVVSHSLGTIISYSLLTAEGDFQGWKVPLHLTLGSPLAVTSVKHKLSPIRFPKCVGHWFNAMDERDVVALYPLNKKYFPITPSIENKTNIDNHTSNRHGIDGYLDDAEVALRIYKALTA
ncbi:hypothetical protein ACJJIU_08195 [Microbulbifer sp. CnH-101-E]|uniref:hypothetical protein n=1 Tax=unclassified Microbulbifer TaxID=2619833 RepID=UPI0040392B13